MIIKPLGRKAKEFGSKVVRPFLKKKAKETISEAGDRLGKKAIEKWTQKSENAGELIRRRLDGKQRNGRQTDGKRSQRQSQTEDANAFLNNLIAMS